MHGSGNAQNRSSRSSGNCRFCCRLQRSRTNRRSVAAHRPNQLHSSASNPTCNSARNPACNSGAAEDYQSNLTLSSRQAAAPPIASSSGAAIPSTAGIPSVGAALVAPSTSLSVGNASRNLAGYTYSAPSAASYTRSPSIPGYYSRYYDYNYRPPVGEHYVGSYTRRDGTFVSGHYRTNRDDSFWNKYSSYGNINPHTGRTGYKLPRVRSTGYKLPRVGRTYSLRFH
jgi:hypothetical protein